MLLSISYTEPNRNLLQKHRVTPLITGTPIIITNMEQQLIDANQHVVSNQERRIQSSIPIRDRLGQLDNALPCRD